MPCPAMVGAALATWFGQPVTERAGMETGGRLAARLREFPGSASEYGWGENPGHHAYPAGRTGNPTLRPIPSAAIAVPRGPIRPGGRSMPGRRATLTHGKR